MPDMVAAGCRLGLSKDGASQPVSCSHRSPIHAAEACLTIKLDKVRKAMREMYGASLPVDRCMIVCPLAL